MMILSNVLDAVPGHINNHDDDLEQVLKPGGYWFIKMTITIQKEEA